MTEDPRWWKTWFGVPPWYDRLVNRRRWDDGLDWSPRLGVIALAAILIGGFAVLAGYIGEWQDWNGVVIAFAVGWLLGAVAFVVAVGVASRRAGRPFWRVAWDALRGLLGFIFEAG